MQGFHYHNRVQKRRYQQISNENIKKGPNQVRIKKAISIHYTSIRGCLFCRFFTMIPVVNDDLPARVIAGRVLLKPNVKEFRGSSAVFVDGSIVDKVQCSSITKHNPP